MNNKLDSTTGFAPNELVFGKQMTLLDHEANPIQQIADPAKYWELIKTLVRPSAYANLKAARQKQAKAYNKRNKAVNKIIAPGSLVYVKKNLIATKHEPPFFGPCRVEKQADKPDHYVIFDIKTQSRLSQPVELSRLKLWNVSQDDLLPTLEDDNVFEVKEIVGHRYNKYINQLEYLIVWLGYEDEDPDWVAGNNLLTCADALKRYWNNKGFVTEEFVMTEPEDPNADF